MIKCNMSVSCNLLLYKGEIDFGINLFESMFRSMHSNIITHIDDMQKCVFLKKNDLLIDLCYFKISHLINE